jgi:glycine oxidase
VTIIVMGAGIIGCSIAHELAVRGARVRIVDPRPAGEGATQASAGTLAPYIEGHSDAQRTLGAQSLALFDDYVQRVMRDGGGSFEYARSGTLQIARTADEGDVLSHQAQQLAAAGVAHELMTGADAMRLEPGLAAAERALLIPEHGLVGVQDLTRALERAIVRHGGEWSPERIDAVAAARDADAVVVATGAWAGDPVRPIRGQLVHLRFDAPPVDRVIWGNRCYAVPWRDGSLLVGATVEDVGFDESSTPDAVRNLSVAAAELIPAARGARIAGVRVGLRPETPDGLPLVGRSSTMPSVFYATGHYRTGVLLAPLTARLVADLVLHGREDPLLALLSPGRLGL